MKRKIGSHVSFSDKGLLNAAREAVSYGSSTFMIYTGAPQNTKRKLMEEQFIAEGFEVMKSHGIEEIIVHAPYIINLGSYKSNIFELAVDFLQEEIRRTHVLGVKQIVLHPGAFTDKDVDYGIARIAEGLNAVLRGTAETDVKIALETMAGKGSEIGRTFEELARIIDGVEDPSRLSVCFDTCHVHDAGYDIVNDLDDVLQQFDHLIGLERLAVLHLNDSKNPRGAGKDRHAPVGAGWIGFDAMKRIVDHETLTHLPMILETPWIGKDDDRQRPMYQAEIALLLGEVETRLGADFIADVEKLTDYFARNGVDRRDFVLATWDALKNDAKGKKADPREPMDRLFDRIVEDELFPDLTEEQLNQRLTAWFAGVNGGDMA